MKKRTVLFVAIAFTALFLNPFSRLHSQSRKPVIVVSPSAPVLSGVINTIQLSLVNMGVPLQRAEITVRFSGDMDQKFGMSFQALNTEQYGLVYKSHYFSPFPGRDNTQDLVVIFEATQPQGYNQGSSQIPLVAVSYKTVPGIYTASVIPERTKITDNEGNLIASIDTFGTSNYHAQEQAAQASEAGLQGYSLSFESDPIRKWWPTAPNTVQQIDAAIWKDSDGNTVKKFTDLNTEWQVDSNYFEVVNTSSSYFDRCPVPTVGGRSCVRFVAHVITKKVGQTTITVRVTDNTTGQQVWNSYPAEIYSLDTSVTPSVVSPGLLSPYPRPSFIPENTVSTEEFRKIQQKVTYLQTQLDQQTEQLSKTQGLVDRIINFLRTIFRFR